MSPQLNLNVRLNFPSISQANTLWYKFFEVHYSMHDEKSLRIFFMHPFMAYQIFYNK